MAPVDLVLVKTSPAEPEGKSGYPWFKFWPAHWMGDECLRTCSLAAHGLLVGLMCVMHKSGGYLLVNGRQPNATELARLVGAASVVELRRLQKELLDHGVVSRTADGVIYSRRMVRTARRSAIGRETGAQGGNPALLPPRFSGDRPLTQPLTVTLKTEKIEDRRESTPKPPKGVSVADLEIIDALFSRFWNVWSPKKNRKDALTAWRKIRPLPDAAFTDRVVEALERHKQSVDWLKDDGLYIPNASTWLNGERWNNEVKIAPGPAATARTVADVDETARLIAERRKARGRD